MKFLLLVTYSGLIGLGIIAFGIVCLKLVDYFQDMEDRDETNKE